MNTHSKTTNDSTERSYLHKACRTLKFPAGTLLVSLGLSSINIEDSGAKEIKNDVIELIIPSEKRIGQKIYKWRVPNSWTILNPAWEYTYFKNKKFHMEFSVPIEIPNDIIDRKDSRALLRYMQEQYNKNYYIMTEKDRLALKEAEEAEAALKAKEEAEREALKAQQDALAAKEDALKAEREALKTELEEQVAEQAEQTKQAEAALKAKEEAVKEALKTELEEQVAEQAEQTKQAEAALKAQQDALAAKEDALKAKQEKKIAEADPVTPGWINADQLFQAERRIEASFDQRFGSFDQRLGAFEQRFDTFERNVDRRFQKLHREIRRNRREAHEGIALSLATANLRYVDEPGVASFAMGGGHWHDQTGLALGLGYTTPDGDLRLNASLAGTPGSGNLGVGVGVSLRLN